jgi:hypothetical protein
MIRLEWTEDAASDCLDILDYQGWESLDIVNWRNLPGGSSTG